MRACARRPNVFMKVSGLVEGTGRRHNAPRDPDYYAPTINVLWEAFGPDRLIFGSNWPVSALFADYATVFGIVDAW
ncbi:MAG TPA: amidohydrolase family protein, partial [Cyclobacteriaceae bacterium]|nr:amidohydrolase family protein [Cyclobacteriaceae bacterium]